MHLNANLCVVRREETTVTNRVWWISGAVIVAGVVFGLGVILGVMIDEGGRGPSEGDDAADGRADDAVGDDAGSGDDDRGEDRTEDGVGRPDGGEGDFLGPLVEQFLDGLAERFEGRFDDGEGPGRDRSFRLFPDRFELPEDFELPEGFEFPGGPRGLGECLADGLGDLFGEGDRPFGERARGLWERCTA